LAAVQRNHNQDSLEPISDNQDAERLRGSCVKHGNA
jgi:hypothetical protein